MSCYILDAEKMAGLAEYIAALANMGLDYFGYYIPDSLARALSDCRDRSGFMNAEKVYLRLFDLNATAYAGRYKDETKPEPEPRPAPYPQIYKAREQEYIEDLNEYYFKIEQWHYDLLKLTQIYIYQCSESPAYNEPLYKALEELERAQERYILYNQPEYIRAPWG